MTLGRSLVGAEIVTWRGEQVEDAEALLAEVTGAGAELASLTTR